MSKEVNLLDLKSEGTFFHIFLSLFLPPIHPSLPLSLPSSYSLPSLGLLLHFPLLCRESGERAVSGMRSSKVWGEATLQSKPNVVHFKRPENAYGELNHAELR